MSNGGSAKGRLVAIRGGQGSAQEGQPRIYVFRTNDGREQDFPMASVSRVYLGTYPVAAISGSTGPAGLNPGSTCLARFASRPTAAGSRRGCAFAVVTS